MTDTPVAFAEPGTFILGPYGFAHPETGAYAPDYFTFATDMAFTGGRLGVYPRRSTQGPTDPDKDDTLSTVNWMDLTGGIGARVINPSSQLNMVEWSTMDIRYTDGWTNAPRAVMAQPASFTGDLTDMLVIGSSLYGLWGEHLHKWDADAHTWGNSAADLSETPVGPAILFNDTAYFPCGSVGYVRIAESSPGTLGAPSTITGAATPSSNSPVPTSNPRPLRFAIYNENLYCITIASEGYTLALSVTGDSGDWAWPYQTNRSRFVTVNKSYTPHQLIEFINRDGGPALWCIHNRGALRFDEGNNTWTATSMRDVPPHPGFGRAAMVFRPGEDLWIASGGGNMAQYTANNVAEYSAGPAGGYGGIPAAKRGDIVSLTADLANMYALMQGDPALDSTPSLVEDAPSDPLYVPDAQATSSILAYNSKGWFPLWETSTPSGTPTICLVAAPVKSDGTADYRLHWAIGEEAWSMPCRLNLYSAQQGREQGIDQFNDIDYIQWGKYHAGSISRKKLFSHALVLLEQGDEETEYVEIEYQTNEDPAGTWHLLGRAWDDQTYTILPFGLSEDGKFSSGTSALWMRYRLTSYGLGGETSTPVVTAFSIAYLIVPIDAGSFILRLLLPPDTDPAAEKTREQIRTLIYGFAESQEFLHMILDHTHLRAYVAGVSETGVTTQDGWGIISLNIVQVPSGLEGELGG